VKEIPKRFFLVMVSRYSGSSIQCGCLVGYVVVGFIAASYAAFFRTAQIAHPRKAAPRLALMTAYRFLSPFDPEIRPLAGLAKKVVFRPL
jgi:hypothetical protein